MVLESGKLRRWCVAYLSITLVCQKRMLFGFSFKHRVVRTGSSEKKTGTGPLAICPSKTVPCMGHEWIWTTATLSSMRVGDPSTAGSGAGRDCSCNWKPPPAEVFIAQR